MPECSWGLKRCGPGRPSSNAPPDDRRRPRRASNRGARGHAGRLHNRDSPRGRSRQDEASSPDAPVEVLSPGAAGASSGSAHGAVAEERGDGADDGPGPEARRHAPAHGVACDLARGWNGRGHAQTDDCSSRKLGSRARRRTAGTRARTTAATQSPATQSPATTAAPAQAAATPAARAGRDVATPAAPA